MQTEFDRDFKPASTRETFALLVLPFIAFLIIVAIVVYYRYRSEQEPKVDSFQDHSEITKEIIKGK